MWARKLILVQTSSFQCKERETRRLRVKNAIFWDLKLPDKYEVDLAEKWCNIIEQLIDPTNTFNDEDEFLNNFFHGLHF